MPLVELGVSIAIWLAINFAFAIAPCHHCNPILRVRMSAPIPHIKIVMWHVGLQLREARQGTGPLSQLLLLLALGVGLITLLACALGVLLSTL
jgi:hypothetical protein